MASFATDSDQHSGVFLTDRTTGEQRFFPIDCGSSGRKELDLSRARLEEFPEGVLALTEVEDLTMAYCNVTTVPQAIEKMRNIRSLALKKSGLCEFPSAVAGLPNLTHLDISGNVNLTSFPPGVSPHLKRLNSLFMIGCNVESLPPDFSEMQHLEHLDLRHNPLPADNLASAVTGLAELHTLALHGSKLADFIEQMPARNQSKVHTIDIRGTHPQISSLPSRLVTLQLLDTLYVHGTANYFPLIRDHLVRAAAHGSDLVLPPPEVVDGGQDAVDAYYSSLEETSASRQKRGKVVVNGKSMAGKTSLVNAIEEVLTQQADKPRLTEEDDRTVSVEQHQLQLDDIDINMLDTGGHNAYELTNQVVTSDNSLILTVIDSSQYKATREEFHQHIGKYLHICFDLLFRAFILIVLSKVDICEEDVHAFTGHIKDHVKEFVEERKASRRNATNQEQQNIRVHSEIILTSAKTLVGIKKLVDCMTTILHQPGCLPSVERTLPQSWVNGEDALKLTAGMLTPPIATLEEIGDLFETKRVFGFELVAACAIQRKHVPHFLRYLHQVGSALYFSRHHFLHDFVFPGPWFVVDLLKTLYRHDIKSLTLTEVDQRKACLEQDVTDMEFERMKTDVTENGTVSMDFLYLIFSHFGFSKHHYELLLNLMFKFDLAYPKCKDAATHKRITQLITEHTIPQNHSKCYSQLREEHKLPPVSDGEKELRDQVYSSLKDRRDRNHTLEPGSYDSSHETLLSALDSSGSSLLLPWFLPACPPCDLPKTPPSSTCNQVVATYSFRHSVPLGLFHRLSARSSRHSVYKCHWKSGLCFQYGPVVATFKCIPVRPLPAITLTFTAARSRNNRTRLCHVMWRCIEDMESLLQTTPGAVVSRYISKEALKADPVKDVGSVQSSFCPIIGGPSFDVQTRSTAGSGIDVNVLSALEDVARSNLVSVPLCQVFAADVGDELIDEQINAVSKDIKNYWEEIAPSLFIHEYIIDELSGRGSSTTQARRMLQKLRESMPQSATVCVLCDALQENGLQSVADKHFNPNQYMDKVLRPPPLLLPSEEERQSIGHEMMRSGADHCGTERGLQACADVAQADRTVEALLQRDRYVTLQHVEVVVKCCSSAWRSMGRVLLRRSDTEVEDLVSHLTPPVKFSNKLHCLIEEWLKEKEENDEHATVRELLEACGHPDIERRGFVEQSMEEAGLL